MRMCCLICGSAFRVEGAEEVEELGSRLRRKRGESDMRVSSSERGELVQLFRT